MTLLEDVNDDDMDIGNVFYHGTSRAKLPDIMKNGLDPAKSQWADDEEENFPDEPGGHYFVYLAISPSTSQSYVDDYVDEPEGGVMLKITLPPSFIEQLVLDRGEYIRCPVVIPPEYIEIL
jgi:hypothetical protein